VISSESPKPLTRRAQREIKKITAQFPPGSLVMIEWWGIAPYDNDENVEGWELDEGEPALVVRMLPELAFQSYGGPWVVPFECLYAGGLRVSTTFATRLAGEE